MIKNVNWLIKRIYQIFSLPIRVLAFKNKKNGIVGLMRVFNEDCYLSNCIDSIIDSLDKLIIIYHDILDNSIEIINKYKQKFPEKIFSYEYKYNNNFYYHKYSNYGLKKAKKTRCKYYIPIDADHIFLKKEFDLLIKKIKNENEYKTYFISGINLFQNNNDIYFLKKIFYSEKLNHYLLPINGLGDHYITPNVFLKYRKFKGKDFSIEKIPFYKFSNKFEISGLYWMHLSFLKRKICVNQKFLTKNIYEISIEYSDDYDVINCKKRLRFIKEIDLENFYNLYYYICNNLLKKINNKQWVHLKTRK